MKLKTPTRPNYSRYAKLCDQTFYHDSEPSYQPPPNYEPASPKENKPHQTTYGFTGVGREKRGNFKWSIYLPEGEFQYDPNHFFGSSRKPSWSFSKTQKYGKEKAIEYEVSHKHPWMADEETKMRASCSSLRQTMGDKVKMMRSTSMASSCGKKDKQTKVSSSRNYSILGARETSPVGFFNTTKISKPRYISKQELNRVESDLDEKHYQARLVPCPEGYIKFGQRRARKPNSNHKGHTKIQYSYSHEKHFNNFKLTSHPTSPEKHIDMEQHLDRPDYTPDKLGPNTQTYSIEQTRHSHQHINLLLGTFRDKITTRQDRVGPEPNTMLDYKPHEPTPRELPNMLEMDRAQGRTEELWPIVDPAIKKAGDKEMKEELKRHIPIKEINEAHRPKNVVNYGRLARGQVE